MAPSNPKNTVTFASAILSSMPFNSSAFFAAWGFKLHQWVERLIAFIKNE